MTLPTTSPLQLRAELGVLARLHQLNHERWIQEQKAAESDKPESEAKKKGKGRKKSGEPKADDGGEQLGLV